jgi:heat-inducible transcriptional repressor
LGFSISSATVRNELAELAELGLLEQPHISAGRIPSHLGYRIYVVQMVGQKPKGKDNNFFHHLPVPPTGDMKDLTAAALKALTELTNCAAVSITPISNSSRIKNIQLVLAGKTAAIVVLITSLGIIKNKLVKCEYEITLELLPVLQEVLQNCFQQMEISEINQEFLNKIMVSIDQNLLYLLHPFINAVVELAAKTSCADITLEGQLNLLLSPEFDQESIKQAIGFLNSTEDVLSFLLKNANEDTKVLIGEETGLSELCDLSIIISKYELPQESEGAIALIGPTRMDYAKMIPSVQNLALAISRFLNEILDI